MNVLENLQESYWTQDTVNAAIASKAERRLAKGRNLYCYSLDLSARMNRTERFNEDNLKEFVDEIYQIAQKSKKPIRFQLALKISGLHWTALDIEVSSEGVKMFQVDAASNIEGYIGGELLFNALKSKFPSPKHSKRTILKHGEINDGTGKTYGIQYDESNCSRFTLDHLFHLSELNTFEIIEKNQENFYQYMSDRELQSLSEDTMPAEMAFLYRNTQSKTSFNALPEHLKQSVVNKKGETLAQSESRHTENVDVKGRTKASNRAIFHKKENFISDVQEFSVRPNFTTLVQDRDALFAMRNQSFLAQSQPTQQKVNRSLIDEAKKIESFKSQHKETGKVQHFLNKQRIKKAESKADQGKSTLEVIKQLSEMKNKSTVYKKYLTQLKQETKSKDNDLSNNEGSSYIGGFVS